MCSFSAGRVVTPVNNLKLLIDHTKISTSSWLQFYFMFLSPFILWFIHFITYAGEFTSLTLELHCTQQFFACCAAQLFCFQRIVTNYIYIIHRFFWFFFFFINQLLIGTHIEIFLNNPASDRHFTWNFFFFNKQLLIGTRFANKFKYDAFLKMSFLQASSLLGCNVPSIAQGFLDAENDTNHVGKKKERVLDYKYKS